MKYHYSRDFRASLEPGKRLWASGFAVSKASTKIIRNLPPTYVEIICSSDPMNDAILRQQGFGANFAAPVINGQVVPSRYFSPSYVNFCQSEADALAEYRQDVSAAYAQVRAKAAELDGLAGRIGKIKIETDFAANGT